MPSRCATIARAMDEALAAFRQYLTAEKRASVHTLRAYLHDLDELRAHATRGARARARARRA